MARSSDHFPEISLLDARSCYFSPISTINWTLSLTTVMQPTQLTQSVLLLLGYLAWSQMKWWRTWGMLQRWSFALWSNNLQGLDCSLCQGRNPVTINVKNNANLAIFENPYRFCVHILDTFAIKPKMILSGTKVPCDQHRCWMKKYASKFTFEISSACPDGRQWSTLTSADVCTEG